MGVGPDEDEAWIRARSLEYLGDGGRGVDAAAWADGRALDLEATVELAMQAV
jgi:hypothetical protein